MTSPIFQPGIYWQAIINTGLNVILEPNIGMSSELDVTLDVVLQPRVGIRGPRAFHLFLSPAIGVTYISEESGSFHTDLTPSIGIETTLVPVGVFNLTLSPQIGVSASHKYPGKVYSRVAVHRAASI